MYIYIVLLSPLSKTLLLLKTSRKSFLTNCTTGRDFWCLSHHSAFAALVNNFVHHLIHIRMIYDILSALIALSSIRAEFNILID